MSITEFYVDNIDPEIDAEQKGTLSKAYVGKWNCLDLIDISVEFNAALNSFGLFIVTVESCYYVYNTISYFEFRKSLSRNQPPARMHLLTEEGPETNDQFGVALYYGMLKWHLLPSEENFQWQWPALWFLQQIFLSPVQCHTFLPTKGRDWNFLLSLWM